jgi:hypothetical protein
LQAPKLAVFALSLRCHCDSLALQDLLQFNSPIDFTKGNAMHPISSNLGLVTASAALDSLKHGVSFRGDLSPEVDQWDAHLSRLCSLADQLGPDGLPIVWTEVLQGCIWINLVKTTSKRWAWGLDPRKNLVEVLLVNAKCISNFAPTVWCVFRECHASESIVSIELKQAFR